MMSGRVGLSGLWLALGMVIACSDSDELGSSQSDAARSPDGEAADGGTVDAGPPQALTHVDLLLVVDPSASLAGADSVLQDYLRDITTRVAARAAEIHAGVITMDLGDFGFITPGCSAMGDDAVLRQTGDAAATGCAMTYPPFLRLVPANLTAAERTEAIGTLVTDLACIVTESTASGCGYEQPLEAALKALTPTEAQPWTASRSQYTTALSLRCTQHAAALHPVNRYVEALLELRRQPPQLVVQIIAGLPEERSSVESAEDLGEVLGDPRMTVQLDDAMRTVPVCSRPNGSQAFPARRLVELAQRMAERGARSSAASICADNLEAASATLARQVLEALGPDGT